MIKKTGRRVIFRLSPVNRLSFPVLLNAWEKNGIDRAFEIIICHQPLSPGDLQAGDIILYSLMTSTLPGIHAEIKEIKRKDVLIAGGGPHITGDQELPEKIGIDVLFTGPGEGNFLRFGRDLLDNRPVKNRYTYESSPGSYGDFNAYQSLSKYVATIGPLELMRGCSWNCSYCSTHFARTWYRDIDSINTYLQGMKNRNVKRVNFISPSSMEYGAVKPRAIDLEKIRALLELTRSYKFRFIEYGIFPSEMRPDTVTDEGMVLLKEYVSHKYVTIGGQSGSNRRLKELGRGHTVEDIEKAAAIANNHGFSAAVDFIVGYPGETPGERQETLEFIRLLNKKYRFKAHLHFFIPLPGSAYGYRFPSFLSENERNRLQELRTAGIIAGGWADNEKQAQVYLQWLKDHFPFYYSRFH